MRPEEFGAFLAKQRKARNMTQDVLAGKLCVTVSAVSKWERGKCLPELTKVEEIAKVFGLTVSEVLECRAGAPDKAQPEEQEKNGHSPKQQDAYQDACQAYQKEQEAEEKKRVLRGLVIAFLAVAVTIAVFLFRGEIGGVWNAVFGSQDNVILEVPVTDLPEELAVLRDEAQRPPLLLGILAFVVFSFSGILMLVKPDVFWQLKFFLAKENRLREAPDGYRTLLRICGVIWVCAGAVFLMIGLGL